MSWGLGGGSVLSGHAGWTAASGQRSTGSPGVDKAVFSQINLSKLVSVDSVSQKYYFIFKVAHLFRRQSTILRPGSNPYIKVVVGIHVTKYVITLKGTNMHSTSSSSSLPFWDSKKSFSVPPEKQNIYVNIVL